ncbi:MAG: hypothetical protein AAF799_24210 [Myxococcota bacterium]
MQWLLRGSQQLMLSTTRAAPFAGAVMVNDPHSAAAMLRTVSFDPEQMKTLRQIHTDLTESHNSRTRSDTLVVAEIMSLLATSRLYLFEQTRDFGLTFDVPENEDQDLAEDAVVLEAEPEPPPPEPKPSPVVLAQADALKKAAESGSPFCEE